MDGETMALHDEIDFSHAKIEHLESRAKALEVAIKEFAEFDPYPEDVFKSDEARLVAKGYYIAQKYLKEVVNNA